MTDDLIQRLRNEAHEYGDKLLMTAAADALEAQQQEIAALRAGVTLSDEQIRAIAHRCGSVRMQRGIVEFARAILAASASPATADAPQRHSWTTDGMKIDPAGVWVLASHVATAGARTSGYVVRVCEESDVQCSRGCGTGPCAAMQRSGQ